MKTLQERIATTKADLRNRTEIARTELRTLETLAKAWPKDVLISQVHVHKLYGVSADIDIGDPYRRNGETCRTMEQVALLLNRFPPIPVYMIWDGCLAMRPETDVSDEEAMDENATQIWGVLLQVEAGTNSGGAKQIAQWFTRVGDLIVEISAALRHDCYPVQLDLDTRTDQRTGKILEVRETRLTKNPQFSGNFWIDQRVKWATGGPEYANRFTLYWLAIDDSDKGAGHGPGSAWLEQICGIDNPKTEG
jgi:hypothetical protein